MGTSPPSKDRTCCCSCLWLPLPSRHPRPSGTPTWCRMCTTSTPSSMPSTESTLTLATHPICCRIPQHGNPQHLASLPLQRQGLEGQICDDHLHLWGRRHHRWYRCLHCEW